MSWFVLLLNVGFHHGFILGTDTFGKIAITPKAISPQKFFQFWVFLPDDPTASSFETVVPRGQTIHLVLFESSYVHGPDQILTLQSPTCSSDNIARTRLRSFWLFCRSTLVGDISDKIPDAWQFYVLLTSLFSIPSWTNHDRRCLRDARRLASLRAAHSSSPLKGMGIPALAIKTIIIIV